MCIGVNTKQCFSLVLIFFDDKRHGKGFIDPYVTKVYFRKGQYMLVNLNTYIDVSDNSPPYTDTYGYMGIFLHQYNINAPL